VAITVSLLGCSNFLDSARKPHYPTIRDAIYSSDGTTVIESNNVLKRAVKENRVIPLASKELVNSNAATLFAEIIGNRGIGPQDLYGSEFHYSLEQLIKQFTCELYASQQPEESIQLCPMTNEIVDNNLDYLPFVEGQRTTSRLAVSATNAPETLEVELFLKSTNERSLDTLWGAVHELGQFKGSALPSESLVLTVNLQAYKKVDVKHGWKELYKEPLIFFVILPSVEQLLNRQNEVESMRLAYRNAKIVLVESAAK
tara:strand:+ start:276 stop:1046 length:771 start_codon:yes stop_codon:yes gene_type:complete